MSSVTKETELKPPPASPSVPATEFKPPQSNHVLPAVVSFGSGSESIVLGNLDRKSQGDDVKVSFTTVHRGTDRPYLGFRVDLRREPATSDLYRNSTSIAILFKYHNGNFTCEHGKANVDEKNWFLSFLSGSESCKQAVKEDKLYVLKLTSTEGRNGGPEVTGYGASFVGADVGICNIHNHLSSVCSGRTVTIWLHNSDDRAHHVQWILDYMEKTRDPLEPYYHTSKKTSALQPHVQWNSLRPIPDDYEIPFHPRTAYHDFGDFGVMNGNAEAYNAQNAFKLAKQLRNTRVAMSVFMPPSSKGDYYWVGLTIPDFENKGQLFKEQDSLLLCDQPAPEQTAGEKTVPDKCPGWRAVVLSDDYNLMNADVALLLERPTNPEHPLHSKKIEAATSLEQELPVQYAYPKLFLSAITVKGRLSALENHRFKSNPGEEFDTKRRILIGRDLSVTSTHDMLRDLSGERIDEIAEGMNEVQKKCFTMYCRSLENGIGLIHGPGGTGKTLMVAKLAESVAEQNRNCLIVTSQNSAADSAIAKLVDSSYMVVRAHSLGLERMSLLEGNPKGQRRSDEASADTRAKTDDASSSPKTSVGRAYSLGLERHTTLESSLKIKPRSDGISDASSGPKTSMLQSIARLAGFSHVKKDKDDDAKPVPSDEFPDPGSNDDFLPKVSSDDGIPEPSSGNDDDEPDFNMDITMRVTVDFMNLCEEAFSNKDSILRPADPRMQKLNFAIHTWVLRLANIIPSKWSLQPTEDQMAAGAIDEWAIFRNLYFEMKVRRLNEGDWTTFTEQFSRIASEVIQRARIITCTPPVVDSKLLKAKSFDDVINDETSVTTTLEALVAWRKYETLILVGDDNQLRPPVFTGSEENPFYQVMQTSLFARFRDLGMPTFLLTDQMRMPAGMMHMSNDIIYEGKLRDGIGTSLAERPDAQDLKTYFSKAYPSLQAEPDGLVYPVFLNVHGESTVEGKGTSVFNSYNVAATIEEIMKLIGNYQHADSTNVGIATPYRAQIRKYRRALKKASQEYPDLNLQHIRIGTAEHWQGGELAHMFVDLVRGSNDAATLGFLSDSRRLNVLITRQTAGLWVICDERCVLTLAKQAERDNPIQSEFKSKKTGKPEKKSREDQKNKTVIAILDWMRKHGRAVNIAKESLSDKYVAFPTEADTYQVPSGWGGQPTSAPATASVDEATTSWDPTAFASAPADDAATSWDTTAYATAPADEATTSWDTTAFTSAPADDATTSWDTTASNPAVGDWGTEESESAAVDWNATVDESNWEGGRDSDGGAF